MAIMIADVRKECQMHGPQYWWSDVTSGCICAQCLSDTGEQSKHGYMT